MKCCGENRLTNFCPECGQQIMAPHPLDSLLAHLSAFVRGLDKQIRQSETRLRDNPPTDEHYLQHRTERLEKRKKTRAKYNAWKEDLAKLIAEKKP